MTRLLAIVAAAVLAGCATSQGAREPGQVSLEAMDLTNRIPFDVAACQPRVLELSPVTPEVLSGALLSLSPAFQECFVDVRSLDGAELRAQLRASVGAEVAFEVIGTGVSPAGKACLVAAARRLPLKPLEARARPVSAEVPVGPGSRSVVFGVNLASDVVGLLRLAQPGLCPCFGQLGTRPAPVLLATVSLARDRPARFIVTEASESSGLAGCVQEHLEGAALPLPAAEGQVRYELALRNAYASGPPSGATPAQAFQHQDAMRAQRMADVLMAEGRRQAAAAAHEALARSRARRDLGELRSRCLALAGANEAWLSALRNLKAGLEASLALVKGERARDGAWAPVEEALSQQLLGSAAQQTRAEGLKLADEGACARNR